MFARLSLLILLIAVSPARAAPLLLGAGPISPEGRFEQLIDPDGSLTPAQAQQSTDWQPLAAGLKAGFTPAAIWLRVTVQRERGAVDDWVLQLSNALLDDVRLYRTDAGGIWREQRSGEDVPRADWPLDYRTPAFVITLTPDEPTTVLLRLRSKNAMAVAFTLWPDNGFGNFSRRESMAYGLYGGFCLLLVLFHVVFWRMTQAPDSGWYLAYLTTILTTTLLSSGLPQQLLQLPVWLSDPLLGCSLTIGSLPIGAAFTMRQLQMGTIWPQLERALVGIALLIGSIAAGAVLTGHYGIGAPLAQITSLAFVPIFLSAAVVLSRRGHGPARFFLFAFGIFYMGVVVAYLRNLGVLPANVWTDNATMIGTLLHMSIMSLRIISHYNQLKRDWAVAQAQAHEASRSLADRLEHEVAIRTAALQQALANETRMRQEQRDFVAMVSHEFRTPLAIIDTSAQQLARNPEAPAEKTVRRSGNIRDAVARMLALVDDYLTADRMDGHAHTARAAACPLPELLDDVLAEWPPTRIRLDTPWPALELAGDRGLLHVALRNLVANADRHAPAATPIHLNAAVTPDGDLTLRIANACARPIPRDERTRLFEKYYRGRQAQHSPGAGLGLYLVRRIARLHNGDVVLEDGGEGSATVVFRLTLPAAMLQPAQPRQSAADPSRQPSV